MSQLRPPPGEETVAPEEPFWTAGIDVDPRWLRVAVLTHVRWSPSAGEGDSCVLAAHAIPIGQAADPIVLVQLIRRTWNALLREASLTSSDITMVGWTGTSMQLLDRVRPFFRRQLAEAVCSSQPSLTSDAVFAAASGAALLAAHRSRWQSTRVWEIDAHLPQAWSRPN